MKRASAAPGIRVELRELLALREAARAVPLRPRGRPLATRSGGHLSRFRGRGMEFDEARIYQAGDDVRHMDWRVTARSGQPHVKLFREERERPVWLLVDQGEGMRFGTRVAFKSVAAARAAALLAWSAADQGDRVGGLVFAGGNHREVRPAARSRGVLPLLKGLSEAPADDGTPGIDAALVRLARLARPGSLLFLISDFFDLGAGGESALARLAGHCEITLLCVHDPIEAQAPPPGRYPVSDGVHGAVLDTFTRQARRHYAEHFDAHRRRLEALTGRLRLHSLHLATDAPPARTLAAGLGGAAPIRAEAR